MKRLVLLGHRLSIAVYLLFALFPLYGIIKISLTLEQLLFSKGAPCCRRGLPSVILLRCLLTAIFRPFLVTA